MRKSGLEAPIVTQVSGMEFRGEVCFDADLLRLEGRYSDELCAHRARRVWVKVFETSFLLEPIHDFTVAVERSMGDDGFILRCSFVSACGRYAFWRLTHAQAPEAQYILETAHIPNSNNNFFAMLAASDLRPIVNGSISPSWGIHRLWHSIKGAGLMRWFSGRRLALRRFYRQISR